MPRNTSQRQLNKCLTLHAWLNNYFGYKTTLDLLNDVRNVDEGFNPDGYSPICEFLMTCAEPSSVIEAALSTYDTNIKRHLAAINNKRAQPVVLRYFQYLALLYTEIFLDWKFNRPAELLRQLNDTVQHRNNARAPGDAMDTPFTCRRSRKTCLLDGNRRGKNPHHAHQLPPVPLTTAKNDAKKHCPHHTQRRVERSTSS